MNHWLPLVLVFVLGLSFVLLIVVFRSIVDCRTASCQPAVGGRGLRPARARVPGGVGVGPLGFQQVDVIEAWVPLFLFAVLFGLSMDYHVFLLSRIRERYSQTATRATRSPSASARRRGSSPARR